MEIDEIFSRLRFVLTQIQLTKTSHFDNELITLLETVFDLLTTVTFEESRYIRAGLFNISDEHELPFFSALFVLLRQQLNDNFVGTKFLRSDSEINPVSESIGLGKIFESVLENNLSKGGNLRLNEEMVLGDLDADTLNKLFSLIIHSTQRDLPSYFMMEQGDLSGIILSLVVARNIALKINKLDVFYATIGIVVERLNISQDFQVCRDFAEESLLTSYYDEKPEWGYFILFLALNGQQNFSSSLIYANTFLAFLKNKNEISELLGKRFLFNLIRFYRNAHFHDEVRELYTQMKKDLPLADNDLFNITITYFTSAIMRQDKSIVPEVYAYLTSNREFVFSEGKNAAIALLPIIYNLKQMFEADISFAEFEMYINILETIVGQKDSERLKSVINGDGQKLKEVFIQNLLKASNSRDTLDFDSEIKQLLIVANKLIKSSSEFQDRNYFLLAMLLKSDNSSLLIKQNVSKDLKYVNIRESMKVDESRKEIYEQYSNYIKENLISFEADRILWLGSDEKNVYTLSLHSDNFSEIVNLNNWNIKEMNNWLSKDFADLAFDTTLMKSNQIEQYLEEDQRQDLENIRSQVAFSQTNITDSQTTFIIKDSLAGGMPHNLILDADGEFLSLKSPLCCLPSIEWLIGITPGTLNDKFTSSVWIPIEEQDYALNILFSKLEDTIDRFRINSSTSAVPESPLQSDINILCAHGAKDIASFNSIFLNDEKAIVEINRIVSSGKILILFVCHSGSMEESVLRQKILTLVYKFLNTGYEAVIAPFWSLHIAVPPIWLPRFLQSIDEGKTVTKAVYDANNEVFGQFKNPGAWACLHLYGNPRFSK